MLIPSYGVSTNSVVVTDEGSTAIFQYVVCSSLYTNRRRISRLYIIL